MPGFTLSNVTTSKINRADYKSISKKSFDQFKLSSFHYSGYPIYIQEFKNGDYIFIEGKIYNHEISEVAASINHHGIDIVAENIIDYDGEFIILYYSSNSGKIEIINDYLGTLPVYIYHKNADWIISREIELITKSVKKLEKDSFGVACSLFLGHPMSNDTLWCDIKKAPTNSKIDINTSLNRVEICSVKTTPNSNHIDCSTKNLLDLIKESIINRSKKTTAPSLALSGGLDSRLIAAVSAESNQDLTFQTFIDNKNNSDVESAKKIIERLDIKHKHSFYNTTSSGSKEKDELFNIKQGLNPIIMSDLLPFLKNNIGKSLITGDGGDYILSDITPYRKINSFKNLISELATYRSIASIETAIEAAHISKTAFLSRLETEFDNYPKSNYTEKYTHFLLTQRLTNLTIEGLDRNRFYCWSTSPYLNPKVIRCALGINQKDKKKGKLFLELFNKTPYKLGEIANPNWNSNLYQTRKIGLLLFKQSLKRYKPTKKFKKSSEFEHIYTSSGLNKDEITFHLDSKSSPTFMWNYCYFKKNNLI